jgi:urease accessory protein
MKHASLDSRFIMAATLLLTALLHPSLAHAHAGHDHAAGFIHGFSHPFLGWDHVCAMIAVGLWSVQMGGRMAWKMPLVFLAVMAFGGILGIAGISVSYAEIGIILSILVLGTLIAFSVRLPFIASASMVGIFALCHGYAHGIEVPKNTADYAYMEGFLLATAVLHGLGIGIATLAQSTRRILLLRLAGAVIALSGSSVWFAG